MATIKDNSAEFVELEKFVDDHGLFYVLDALARICNEKADHLRTNWQDNLTAKHWEHAGERIDKTAHNVHSGL